MPQVAIVTYAFDAPLMPRMVIAVYEQIVDGPGLFGKKYPVGGQGVSGHGVR